MNNVAVYTARNEIILDIMLETIKIKNQKLFGISNSIDFIKGLEFSIRIEFIDPRN